mmetsp:Transcript_79818/g.234779  ORF Transcript_79818/g.234779 Transcript_79818/m.234779 type:complete len:201 (-) Transcript_79818:61-663(-)
MSASKDSHYMPMRLADHLKRATSTTARCRWERSAGLVRAAAGRQPAVPPHPAGRSCAGSSPHAKQPPETRASRQNMYPKQAKKPTSPLRPAVRLQPTALALQCRAEAQQGDAPECKPRTKSPAKSAFEEQEDPIPRAPTAFEEHVDEHLYKRGQTPAMLRLRRTRSEYTVPKPPAKKTRAARYQGGGATPHGFPPGAWIK